MKQTLAEFDSLPDLLSLARDQVTSNNDVYQLQEELLSKMRLERVSCRTSMPHRHIFSCQLCGIKSPEVIYTLYIYSLDGKEQIIEVWESRIHQIRFHDSAYSIQ
ncbi:MAG: hypothetical protein SH817_02660 [Leptospira sp.]|nr:hypothetical protein [Leptospira sp.]